MSTRDGRRAGGGARRRAAASAAALPRRLSNRGAKGEQLREILEALIASLPAGAPLPSERALAERYGLARMTVRTEIERLTSEGLIYRVHGAGTFVAAQRITQAVALSSFTEDMRARGMEPGSRVLRQEVVAASDRVASRLELAPGSPVVRVDRVRTADGKPMAVEQAFLPAARFPGLDDADLAGGSLYSVLENDWGVRLQEADQRVVAVTLSDEEAELLDVDGMRAGLLFHTVAVDADGEVVFFGSSLYRGDRYEIQLRQARAGGAQA